MNLFHLKFNKTGISACIEQVVAMETDIFEAIAAYKRGFTFEDVATFANSIQKIQNLGETCQNAFYSIQFAPKTGDIETEEDFI